MIVGSGAPSTKPLHCNLDPFRHKLDVLTVNDNSLACTSHMPYQLISIMVCLTWLLYIHVGSYTFYKMFCLFGKKPNQQLLQKK